MRSRHYVLTLISATLAASLSAAPRAKTSAAATSNAEIYRSSGCAECHGYVGQGGNAGPRLADHNLGREAFVHQLRHPAADMPPYSEKVIDAKRAAKLYDYVMSIPGAVKQR